MGLFGIKVQDSYENLPRPILLQFFSWGMSMEGMMAARAGGRKLKAWEQYLEEYVKPKFLMAMEAYNKIQSSKIASNIDKIIDMITSEIIEKLKEAKAIDKRHTSPELTKFRKQIADFILRGYSLAIIHDKIDGQPLITANGLQIKKSYCEALDALTGIAKEMFENAGFWNKFLQCKLSKNESKSIEPGYLIEYLIYSGFYFGLTYRGE